jgi:hypothetical protein
MQGMFERQVIMNCMLMTVKLTRGMSVVCACIFVILQQK